MTAALAFTTDSFFAKIYLVNTFSDIDWNTPKPCSLGKNYFLFDYKSQSDNAEKSRHAPIEVKTSVDSQEILRLTETKRYVIKIEPKVEPETKNNFDLQSVFPHLQNENNKLVKTERDNDRLTFQFVNYLGRSKIYFGQKGNQDTSTIDFEVVPDKMNYEDDYIRLTESIAQNCSELLLEYSGATSNIFSQSEENKKTLLEQFIFLRQFCYSENLQSLFEAIKRNPARELVCDEVLKPLGSGEVSKKFFTNPFSYSRMWTNIDGTFLPQEVAVSQKYDSLDTPANRFVKYALQKFNAICEDLIKILDSENSQTKQAECLREAKQIKNLTEEILLDSFFDDVGNMDKVPQNNQILQKREGYAQIFSAVSMIDLALQLDWKGKNDVYQGESKNVALLYEYYLFFELYKIIKSLDKNCKPFQVDIGDRQFIKSDADGITISLQEGKESCQSFELPDLHTKVNLYYNRTFSPKEFSTTLYEGSYSRPFRPDYTIAIFPSRCTKGKCNGEDEAVKQGLVSYIHFDAKYRITDLTSFLGTKSEQEELAEDKSDSITNTYKRGDLLKMHTYNDAIRRTIGSYVLYPGEQTDSKQFYLYEEILPGVGAFAIRPGIQNTGEEELRSFIKQLIEAKSHNYSRLSRMDYYANEVLQEPIIKELDNRKERTVSQTDYENEKYILAYIRPDYFSHLQTVGLLQAGKEFYFYFYAIKDGYVYSHNKDLAKINHIRFYKNEISKSQSYIVESVLGKIIESSLVSRNDLIKLLNEDSFTKHNADFYYVFKVEVESNNLPTEQLSIKEVESQNGNDTFSPHSPKVIGK